ncbi:hypothetical protein [Hymenobacter fodinae]|uniref:Uncharacterized protein n=1 Tax=Hymenobacter fodinae TaxID=2510796 RepID=A0A4Z0P5R0_9BACT|nr:hypothetical protein [Hymenobacter fodinae]TGE07621.1 hypothetical protein EU556_07650 [Hymenobacter fodinae]
MDDTSIILCFFFLLNAAILWLMVKVRQYRTQLLQRSLAGEITGKVVDRRNWNNFSLLVKCADGTTASIPITEQAYDIIHDHDFLHKKANSAALTISRKGEIILQTSIRPLPVRRKNPKIN